MEFDRDFSLADLVDPGVLREVCGAFHELFGITIRAFARDGTLVAEASADEAYCAYLRGFPEGRRRCGEFRGEIKRLRPEGQEGASVTCFSGCSYEVMPITHEGETMGALVFGPYLPAELTELPADLLSLDPSIDARRVGEYAGTLRRIPAQTLDRIMSVLLLVLGLLLRAGYRVASVSEAHITAIQESFRELSEKNKALQATTERLEEMDRLKSNFLAAVSHELRTPLTSIIGFSEMLNQGLCGTLSPEQSQFVRTILEKSEQLLGLISSILDISTLDAGRLSLRREPTDVVAVCAKAVEKVQSQAARKDVRIHSSASGRIPMVSADPDLVEKAVVHLVDNAVKYSPPSGSVTVDVRLVEPDADGGKVGFVLMAPLQRFLAVSVRDSGPGIPEAERERVFEAFYQVDGSATRAHGGLGLGLALVRQFAQAHGGRVEVDGGSGEGSVFRFLLPLPPGG